VFIGSVARTPALRSEHAAATRIGLLSVLIKMVKPPMETPNNNVGIGTQSLGPNYKTWAKQHRGGKLIGDGPSKRVSISTAVAAVGVAISQSLVVTAVTMAVSCAHAATISIASLGPGQPTLVLVEGELEPDDPDQFQTKIASLLKAIVAFQSDGGNLLAGIQIGETIRLKNFATFVPENMRCASACALAWLGGTQRFMATGAKIGFHAAYNVKSGQETGVGNALLGAYLNKIGLPYEAVIYITQAAPDSMTWLSISDAVQRGIHVTLLNSPSSTVNQPASTPLQNPQPIDSLNTRAAEFVTALFAKWSQSNDKPPTGLRLKSASPHQVSS
jgi:hypothetical protein